MRRFDSDLRLQFQTVCLSTSCRNQRRQVPVKVPVKIELAKTQQYSANTGEKRCHNSSGVPKNVVSVPVKVPVKFKARVKLSENAPELWGLYW